MHEPDNELADKRAVPDAVDVYDETSEMDDADPSDEERIHYDLDEWPRPNRSLLNSRLVADAITREWRGTTLIVDPGDETTVDALIEEVEDTEVTEVAESSGLEPYRERVVYAVGQWSVALRAGITDSLEVAAIEHDWDDNGDLVIYTEDEERVEEILDAVPDPDDPEAVDLNEPDAQQIMTAMWNATGTLANHPTRPDAIRTAIDGANAMMRMTVPFGLEAVSWRHLVAKSMAIRDALETEREVDQLSDAEFVDGCRDLHRRLGGLI